MLEHSLLDKIKNLNIKNKNILSASVDNLISINNLTTISNNNDLIHNFTKELFLDVLSTKDYNNIKYLFDIFGNKLCDFIMDATSFGDIRKGFQEKDLDVYLLVINNDNNYNWGIRFWVLEDIIKFMFNDSLNDIDLFKKLEVKLSKYEECISTFMKNLATSNNCINAKIELFPYLIEKYNVEYSNNVIMDLIEKYLGSEQEEELFSQSWFIETINDKDEKRKIIKNFLLKNKDIDAPYIIKSLFTYINEKDNVLKEVVNEIFGSEISITILCNHPYSFDYLLSMDCISEKHFKILLNNLSVLNNLNDDWIAVLSSKSNLKMLDWVQDFEPNQKHKKFTMTLKNKVIDSLLLQQELLNMNIVNKKVGKLKI